MFISVPIAIVLLHWMLHVYVSVNTSVFDEAIVFSREEPLSSNF